MFQNKTTNDETFRNFEKAYTVLNMSLTGFEIACLRLVRELSNEEKEEKQKSIDTM